MKINNMLLVVLFGVSPAPLLPAIAADGLPGATVTGDSGATAGLREHAGNRREPSTGQRQAAREQWCKDNAQKCSEARAKVEQRREQCRADPAKCRAEFQARQQERFRRADTDGNGALNREEAGKGARALARHFDKIDANRDGQITNEEIQAARKQRGGARRDKTG